MGGYFCIVENQVQKTMGHEMEIGIWCSTLGV